MKKLLLILLCLPMIGFGQSAKDCISTHSSSLSGSTIKINFCYSNFVDANTMFSEQIYQLQDKSKYDRLVRKWDEESKGYQLVVSPPYHPQDKWWVSNEDTLNILSNNFITYRIPLTTGSRKFTSYYNVEVETSWKNGRIKNDKGYYRVLEFDYNKCYHLDLIACIKQYVDNIIHDWQEKEEFEKTTDYLVRVNEKTRAVKIKVLQEAAIESLKLDFLNSIDFSDIELGVYDADNEAFILKDSVLGNLVIPVPLSEAKLFKANFSSIQFADSKCIIIDDKFVLSYLELSLLLQTRSAPNIYTYNLSNTQDYTITDIDYDFSAIEIDDITSSKTTKTSNISTNYLKVGTSSVNINIPTNKKVKNRYALVIGNEDYTSFQRTLSSEQNVDYAVNDASTFKKYCLKTLGVKEDNMFFLLDATTGQMSQEIDLISKILSKLGDEAELIIYYAGHGFPDELTKIPYLIPVDVSATNLSSAIKLSEIYTKLSSTGARKVTVFLDACFTGGGRNSGLIASRGVKVKPKEGSLSGNLVVFSASSEDQSALPYHKEGHGMFTYHLLKKLQETNGDVSMGELSDYLDDNVSLQSLKENKKEQDPIVNTSSKVINDWRNWKF